VVDDDPDMRHILRAWIEQAGATVLSAADGAHALEVARENKPDLVFCDLRMPRFDGYAFMDGFARDQQLCHVPVLVLSGEMDPAEIRRTWEAGFSGTPREACHEGRRARADPARPARRSPLTTAARPYALAPVRQLGTA
jgi:CheY-like chemotaxis protein